MPNDDIRNRESLEEAIIRVIVFFDLFDYPLTAYEIRKYLDREAELIEIIETLDTIKKISQVDGLFFLSGREKILAIRQERHNYSLRKIKIACRFTLLFKILPFIKAVILSNSIGQNNLRDGSDIDFLIITAPHRLWLTRLFCTGIAKLANRRPTEKNKRDKICLSFYLSAEKMNLNEFKLAGGDPYFFYWLRSFVLLYNKDKTYEKFLAANDIPEIELEPGIQEKNLLPDDADVSVRSSFILDTLEKLASKLQYLVMSQPLKKANNNSDGVVINNRVLKLYLNDKRREYAEKYGNKLRQIFTENN